MKLINLSIVLVAIAICLAIAVPFTGCNPEIPERDHYVAYERIIPIEKQKEAADWITKTVAAANPLSDEEPEDNIRQAQYSARYIFGEVTIGIRTKINQTWYFVPYDQCSAWQKKIIDEYKENGTVN